MQNHSRENSLSCKRLEFYFTSKETEVSNQEKKGQKVKCKEKLKNNVMGHLLKIASNFGSLLVMRLNVNVPSPSHSSWWPQAMPIPAAGRSGWPCPLSSRLSICLS